MGKSWYIKFPADAYALGPVRFGASVREAQVREYARKFEGRARPPRGFQCWPTSD